jgi:hypothetical protein
MQTEGTKIWDRERVLTLIERSNEATGKALWSLYERQTASEQAANATRDRNGRGFNGRDAEFLSSIAKRLPQYDFKLTERQLPPVRRALRKYAGQLLQIIQIIQEKGHQVEFKKAKSNTGAQHANVVSVRAPDRDEHFGSF